MNDLERSGYPRLPEICKLRPSILDVHTPRSENPAVPGQIAGAFEQWQYL